jgi:acetyltransferase-like isoleucine patch superfamily enzyme
VKPDVGAYLLRRAQNLHCKLHTVLVRHQFRRLDSHVDPRSEFTNPRLISIGRGVSIRPYTWIYAITDDWNQKDVFAPSIEINDNCSIGRFCHITAAKRVVLEDHVLIGEGVFIADGNHGYEDVTKPILQQRYVPLGPVVIGAGTWIGNGATIVGKVLIGRNCVIAANAFVNRHVPDYCVVAGAPARIVRRFDHRAGAWVLVDEPLPRLAAQTQSSEINR